MSDWVFPIALTLIGIGISCALFLWWIIRVEPEPDDEYIDYYDDEDEEAKP